MEDDNKLVDERREKLKALRAAGVAFPNDFRRKDLSVDLLRRFGEKNKQNLEREKPATSVAGRMMLKRPMGKVTFATLQDGAGRIQIYVSSDVTGEKQHEEFKHWDLGDIVGVEGTLFRTNKGELTVQAGAGIVEAWRRTRMPITMCSGRSYCFRRWDPASFLLLS